MNCPTIASTDTPSPSVDSDDYTSTLAVAESGTLLDVNVLVNVAATYASDVELTLIAPDGTEVELTSDNGTSDDNYTNTLFDDEADNAITAASPPFTGSFLPEAPLSALDGKSIAGDWKLRITDDTTTDPSVLTNWSITLCYAPTLSCNEEGSGDPPIIIPEEGGITTSITLPGNFSVVEVEVEVDISHVFTGDLDLSLTSPSGTTVELSTDNGSSGSDYVDTIFSDDAETSITTGIAPFTGRFRPEQPLHALLGESSAGAWTLNVTDDQSPDGGTLNGWRIKVCGVDAASEGEGEGSAEGETNCNDHVSDTTPIALSDASSTTNTLEVTSSGIITDLDVGMSIAHPFIGDLVVSITSPSGTTQLVVFAVGDDGDDMTDTVFDDEASTAIADGTPPYNGSYTPDGLLSVFDGEDVQGTWTLTVDDLFANNSGTLIYWGIRACTEPGSEGEGVAEGEGEAPPCLTVSADPLLTLADSATTTTSFEVLDDEIVDDVNVLLNVNHPFIGDLIVSLYSPSGTKVELINQAGGSGSNLAATDFDDEAPDSILVGSAPFLGNWQPMQPLSAFDGEGTQGIWTLEIKDEFSGNTGTLSSWQLVLCRATPTEGEGEGEACLTTSAEPFLALNDADTTTTSFDLLDDEIIDDVRVRLDIEHPSVDQLSISLYSPQGTRVELMNQPSGAGSNLTNTVFDDTAATPLTSGSAPFTGSWQPITPLSAFDGETTQDTWTLEIKDEFSGFFGTLNSWSLIICRDTGGEGEGVVEGEGEGVYEGEGEGVYEGEGEGVYEGEGEGSIAGDCAGGLGTDDGVPSGGLGFNNSNLFALAVNRMTPPGYPYTLSEVCVNLIAGGINTSLNYDVVVFNDNGGVPGSLLANVPGQSLTLTGAPDFYSTDVSAANIQLTSGDYYIGIQYSPQANNDVNFYMDSSNEIAPVSYTQSSGNLGVWSSVSGGDGVFGELMIRAKGSYTLVPETCEDGIVSDEGTVSGGVGMPAGTFYGIIAKKLTPTSYPYTITDICVCLRTASIALSSANYEVVLFSDGGTAPGTSLLTLPGQVATGLTEEGQFYTTDISALGAPVVINSGSVYVGIQYAPNTSSGLEVCIDPSVPATPIAVGQNSSNPGTWFALLDDATNNANPMIRLNGSSPAEAFSHSGDQDSDGTFDLTEVLRIVQLYNAGEFHCETGTEDGYAPGPGDILCTAHSADYEGGSPFVMTLSELLRLIQLYNNEAYYECGANEDGFCAGTL